MFPITCNAFGDIVAVAQIICSIAKALKESGGAAQDYREFAHELYMTGSVMREVHRMVQESSNDALRELLLVCARSCCDDLEMANELTSGFAVLISVQSESIASVSRLGAGKWLVQGVKKLRWHFMKSQEAARFTQLFRDHYGRIQLCLILLNL